MNKEECKAIGGEWVSSYRKKDGTLVKSYCKSHEYVNNKKIDKSQKKRMREQKANQQVILNQLRSSVRMYDLDDAKAELSAVDGVMFGDKDDKEYYGGEHPELYDASNNVSPEFKRALKKFINSEPVRDFSDLSAPRRWGPLDPEDIKIGDEYNRVVRKFIKEWRHK